MWGAAMHTYIPIAERGALGPRRETPTVQKRTVHIPPPIGLGIAAVLFGVRRLAFAIPIAAAAKVIIEEL